MATWQERREERKRVIAASRAARLAQEQSALEKRRREGRESYLRHRETRIAGMKRYRARKAQERATA